MKEKHDHIEKNRHVHKLVLCEECDTVYCYKDDCDKEWGGVKGIPAQTYLPPTVEPWRALPMPYVGDPIPPYVGDPTITIAGTGPEIPAGLCKIDDPECEACE